MFNQVVLISIGEPPLLQREPPRDYLSNMNLHQNYQGRAGHLVAPPDPRMGQNKLTTPALPRSVLFVFFNPVSGPKSLELTLGAIDFQKNYCIVCK